MKKTIRKFAPAMLVLVALATLSFMAKDGVTLRLRPQQDKTQTVTTKANMMTMMEVQGQTMNMSQNMETRQTFTPKEVTDANSVVETQIEAIKMTISQMGMKLEYDSEHPEKTSPMLAGQTKDIEARLHNPTTLTYDALGKLLGDSIDLSSRQLGVIIELPEKEIAVGSTWTSTSSQETNGLDVTADHRHFEKERRRERFRHYQRQNRRHQRHLHWHCQHQPADGHGDEQQHKAEYFHDCKRARHEHPDDHCGHHYDGGQVIVSRRTRRTLGNKKPAECPLVFCLRFGL